MQEKLLKLDNIAWVHKGKKVIYNINFEFFRKEIVTLIGPNGAGKTTTAKIALGILQPSEGRVWHKEGIRFSYVPQKFTLESPLPMKVSGLMRLNKKITEEEIDFYLQQTSALHLKNCFIDRLSGGELQRVLLARSAAQKPDFLVLDEPLQGVDYASASKLYKLISDFRDQINCCILLISHDLNQAILSTDRVICLDKTICCSGKAEQVAKTEHYANLLNEGKNFSYEHLGKS